MLIDDETGKTLKSEIFWKAPIGIAFHDRDLNVVLANRAYEMATGLTAEEMAGKKCYSVWGLSKPCRGCPVVTAVTTGKSSEAELTPQNQDHWPESQGSWLSKAGPVFDDEGDVIGAVEVAVDITSRKLAEEALWESEQELATTFHSIGDAVIVTDPEGRIARMNRVAEELTGWDVAAAKGSFLHDVFQIRNEDTLQTVENPVEKVLRLGVVAGLGNQTVLISKEGHHLPIDDSAAPVRDEEGHIKGVVLVFRDVTEKRQAEKLKNHLNSVLRAIRNINQLIIREKDRNRMIQRACQILVEMGYYSAWIALVDESDNLVSSAEAGVGNRFKLLMDRLTHGNPLPCQREPLTQSKTTIVEEPALSCDCPLSTECEGCSAMVARLEYDAGFFGYLAVSLPKVFRKDKEEEDLFKELSDDIAFALHNLEREEKRKEAVAELRISKQIVEGLIDSMQEGLTELDVNGIHVNVNPAFCSMTGFSREELIGSGSPHPYWPPEEHEAIDKAFQKTRQGKFGELELVFMRKNGERFPVIVSPSCLTDAHKNVVRYFATVKDISDQKRAEEDRIRLESQLRQVQKMEAIGTLAGGIAHDFNNLLGIILGNVELAADDVPQGGPAHFSLTEARQACFRAKDMVRQILAFSREKQKTFQPIDIEPIVKEGLKMLRSSIPTTIEIQQEIASTTDAYVLGDPTQIHQVLMNLCTNAMDAMEEMGSVLQVSLASIELDTDAAKEVSDLTPGRYTRLTVSDTGHGMEAHILDKVFDPYFTTKGPGKGTGIGLSVVYGIVKEHRGAVTVYSEPGKGTTFHVFFPEVESDTNGEWETGAPPPMGTESVLFVDDEAPLTNLGNRMLESLGYKVEGHTSSIEALVAFQENPDKYDVVVTDMTMPNMTGETLARELLEIRPNIPIILCTGFSHKMDEEKAKATGFKSFIMKPLVKSELAKTVRRAIDEE